MWGSLTSTRVAWRPSDTRPAIGLPAKIAELDTPFVRRAITRIAFVTLLSYVAYRAGALVVSGHVEALWLKDFRLYLHATDRWLAGGEFYEAWQLAGPWSLEWGAILYPPVALVFLAPFGLIDPTLSAFLWLTVPAAITTLTVAWWRPTVRGWIAILLLISLYPLALLNWTAGTPTTWFVAAIALGTRWPWIGAVLLLKPTLAPFALLGIRDRRWWLLAAVLVAGSVALAPLTVDWFRMLLDMRGPDATPLYSLANVPLLLVPIAAKLWSSRAPEPSRTRGQP